MIPPRSCSTITLPNLTSSHWHSVLGLILRILSFDIRSESPADDHTTNRSDKRADERSGDHVLQQRLTRDFQHEADHPSAKTPEHESGKAESKQGTERNRFDMRELCVVDRLQPRSQQVNDTKRQQIDRTCDQKQQQIVVARTIEYETSRDRKRGTAHCSGHASDADHRADRAPRK